MKPVCYLDMDGVLTDFVGASLRVHGKYIPPGQVEWDFPTQIGFKGGLQGSFWQPLGRSFWANLDWTLEGMDVLDGLEFLFKGEVVLMTSPCATDGAVEGKVDWIKKHLPKYSRQFFVGPAKHLAAGPGKILVDDHDGNTDKFIQHGGHAVLVPRTWNKRKEDTDGKGGFNVKDLVDETGEVYDAVRARVLR